MSFLFKNFLLTNVIWFNFQISFFFPTLKNIYLPKFGYNITKKISLFFKIIYFASMDPILRKEIWPFLLRVYPWSSTFEQREAIRNELFLSYQNIKYARIKKMSLNKNFSTVESTIIKDVVRTDQKNPFFYGENNPNLETMKFALKFFF